MSIKPALLIALLAAAMLSVSCQRPLSEASPGTTQAPVIVSPQPESPPSPSPAQPNKAPAIAPAVVSFFADAVNNDWDSFVSRFTAEEQLFYRDFFANADNAKLRNGYFAVNSIELLDAYEVADIAKMINESDPGLYDLPYEVWGDFEGQSALDDYGDVRMWIAKVDCRLEKEFWDYRQGINNRVLILVPENGQWKVMQDYQGYPGAGVFFGDAVPEETEISDSAPAQATPNILVDGTLHYTDSMTGYFIGTSVGDYLHVGIRTIEGDVFWFWISSACRTNPETLHRNQIIEIDWENIDVYIDEADEVINLDRITDIRIVSA